MEQNMEFTQEQKRNVHLLTSALMSEIKNHYMGSKPDRVKVFEVLNALALCSAVVIHGAGGDPDAEDFFDNALDNQIISLRKEEEARAGVDRFKALARQGRPVNWVGKWPAEK